MGVPNRVQYPLTHKLLKDTARAFIGDVRVGLVWACRGVITEIEGGWGSTDIKFRV